MTLVERCTSLNYYFISSSTCNVNTDEILNPTTGHVTVRTAGVYFISFTANMVSVKSQAIWCALYKQSPGKDGWEVLGKTWSPLVEGDEQPYHPHGKSSKDF